MMINVHLAMWGYIPLVFLLFNLVEKRKAMLASVLIGVLFLPMYGYKVQGFPPYDKVTASGMVPLLAALIFDWPQVALFRFRWFDAPILLFCATPFCSSIANDLGLYDGLSGILCQAPLWLPCYLLGRIYCNDLAGMKALAQTYFIGGLIYLPLCVWEIRMSPGLHLFLYGYYQHSLLQQVRGNFYRPMVFMQHGLAVGIWMACATMAGFVLWRTKAVTQICGVPIMWLVLAMIGVTLACQSVGASIILGFAIAGFLLMQLGRRRIIILLMVLTPAFYMTSRLTGLLATNTASNIVATHGGEKKVSSFDARLQQEDLFGAKAMERPIFGWGGWGRSWPTDENGNASTRGLDSLWVMTLGENGLLGLSSLTLSLLFPAMVMLWRASAKLWVHPVTGPAAAMAIVLVMYMIDNCFNAMLNPLLMVSAGAVLGWVMQTAPADQPQVQTQARGRLARAPMPRRMRAGPVSN